MQTTLSQTFSGVGQRFNGHKAPVWAFDRIVLTDEVHTGEVLHVAEGYVLVRPHEPLPFEAESDLSEASEDSRTLFVAMDDVKEDGLVLDVGTKVLFKYCMDQMGVKGCEVTSA